MTRETASEARKEGCARCAMRFCCAFAFASASSFSGNEGRSETSARSSSTSSVKDESEEAATVDRKSTRLNSSHDQISYAVFCLKKKKNKQRHIRSTRVHEGR